MTENKILLPRQIIEQNENLYLSEYAVKSTQTKGRVKPEIDCEIRTSFARDRDRIIHSNSFRRLKHKTQVFISPVGDHFRTRLTHTLEVSQIARTIARALRLNEDLTEAIALGHDLGHTAFGHAGETVLNEIAPFEFTHTMQSVRVVEKLEKGCKGLNLTYEVKNGIVSHSSSSKPAETNEGKIVQFADKIAYVNHDIEDAIRAGVICENDLPHDCISVLGEDKSSRINTIIKSIIKCSYDINDIKMDDDVFKAHYKLRKYMFDKVYINGPHKIEENKAQNMLRALYEHYLKNPHKLIELQVMYADIIENEGIDRAICDEIASMSDDYAINLYQQTFVPKVFVSL